VCPSRVLIVSGDPRRRRVLTSATSTGYSSVFEAAGFVEIARRSQERPIMRLILP